VGIGGNGDGGGGLLKSADGGASWKRIPLPNRGGVRAVNMDPQDSSTLYASTHEVLYKSTDGGASWNEIGGQKEVTAGGPSWCFDLPASVVIDPQDASTLYVGTCPVGGGLFKSTDGGQTWSSLIVNLAPPTTIIGGMPIDPSSYFICLAIDPQDSGTVYVSVGNRILKTTDGGQNWESFNAGLPADSSVRFIAIDPQNSSIVYAASNLGVFKSTDGGASWSALNAGLTNANVSILLIDPRDPSTVYAGTYGGGAFAITSVPTP
jgi:photosystem II stability/assembly factor-like uncharacterized protein